MTVGGRLGDVCVLCLCVLCMWGVCVVCLRVSVCASVSEGLLLRVR